MALKLQKTCISNSRDVQFFLYAINCTAMELMCTAHDGNHTLNDKKN